MEEEDEEEDGVRTPVSVELELMTSMDSKMFGLVLEEETAIEDREEALELAIQEDADKAADDDDVEEAEAATAARIGTGFTLLILIELTFEVVSIDTAVVVEILELERLALGIFILPLLLNEDGRRACGMMLRTSPETRLA